MGWLHFCSLPNKHNSVHSLDCSWEQYYRPQTIAAHWLHRAVDRLYVVPAPQVHPQGRVAHCGRTRGPLCPGFCKCAHAALKPVHHSHLLLGKCYQSHFSDGNFRRNRRCSRPIPRQQFKPCVWVRRSLYLFRHNLPCDVLPTLPLHPK